jgi:hypothetical protein
MARYDVDVDAVLVDGQAWRQCLEPQPKTYPRQGHGDASARSPAGTDPGEEGRLVDRGGVSVSGLHPNTWRRMAR